MTFENFQHKEREWKGFKYALRNVGLDSDVLRKRLMKEKPHGKTKKNRQFVVKGICNTT